MVGLFFLAYVLPIIKNDKISMDLFKSKSQEIVQNDPYIYGGKIGGMSYYVKGEKMVNTKYGFDISAMVFYLSLTNGTKISFHAQNGQYMHAKGYFFLPNSVKIFVNGDYTFTSSKIYINVDEVKAYSKEQVQGFGNGLKMISEGFVASKDKIVLKGKTEMILNRAKKE